MKAAFAILLCLAAWADLAAAPLRSERLWPLGKEYYRAEDWAQSRGLRPRWVNKTTLELNGNTSRVVLTPHSRRILLDGIIIWLSHEVSMRGSVAYISVQDVNTALSPVLWPPRNKPREQVKHICIDPGHGGTDTGKQNGAHQEKRYTLLLAQELATQLRNAGFTVSFTRTTDTSVELDDRPILANKRGADLFISLHFNSTMKNGTDVRGAETFCLTPGRATSTNARGQGGDTPALAGNVRDAENMLLAYRIQQALVKEAGIEDRGVKRARFAVLRTARMPAVLIETGFMSNPTEARNIYSSIWRRKTAQAITSALKSYRTTLER